MNTTTETETPQLSYAEEQLAQALAGIARRARLRFKTHAQRHRLNRFRHVRPKRKTKAIKEALP